jgi:hypothetical protein
MEETKLIDWGQVAIERNAVDSNWCDVYVEPYGFLEAMPGDELVAAHRQGLEVFDRGNGEWWEPELGSSDDHDANSTDTGNGKRETEQVMTTITYRAECQELPDRHDVPQTWRQQVSVVRRYHSSTKRTYTSATFSPVAFTRDEMTADLLQLALQQLLDQHGFVVQDVANEHLSEEIRQQALAKLRGQVEGAAQ